MRLIDLATGNTVWRGIDSYREHKVISWEKTGPYTYDGIVAGSENNRFNVHIDTKRPKRSTCNCKFAYGRKIICRHMLALYFTAEPAAAEKFIQEVGTWQNGYEDINAQRYDELQEYVMNLSVDELRDQLLEALVRLEADKDYEDDEWEENVDLNEE